MKNAGGVVLTLLGVAWVKAYGEYKYYAGKVDANAQNKIVIDILKTAVDTQSMVIEKLNKKLKEKGES